MNLRKTNHAQARSRQRGIPEEAVPFIMVYGSEEKAPGRATKYRLDKRAMDQRIHELKREMQMIEKLKNVTLIVGNDDGSVITVYHEI